MKTNTFLKLAKNLFVAAGDTKKTVVFSNVTVGTYDPSTDVRSTTVSTTTVHAVVTQYALAETSDKILVTDRKVKILGADIIGIDPNTIDGLTIDGIDYDIIFISTDPIKAVWTLQVRE